MAFRFLKHPSTGKPDLMATLTLIAVVAAAVKFLLDGVSGTLLGHAFSFGHTDPMTYGTFLTPVLGAHGFINTRANTMSPITQVGNPDEPKS